MSVSSRRAADLNPLRLAAGFSYPMRGAAFLLSHPSLWPWAAAPFLINLAVATYVWLASSGWMHSLLAWMGEGHSHAWWATVLYGSLKVLGFLLRLVIVGLAVLIVGNFASVPFNDFLSERVDRLHSGWSGGEPFSLHRAAYALLQELKRMLLYLTLLLLLILASMSGALAPIALPLKVLLTAAYLSLDHLSYPLERRGQIHLSRKLDYLRHHLAPCLGFGLLMTLLALIPLINFVFLPLGVIGGTLLFADIESRQRLIQAAPADQLLR